LNPLLPVPSVPSTDNLPSATGTLETIRVVIKKSPFVLFHLACLAVFFVPITWTAVGLCLALHVIRMFGITAGYHRYFSHRAYKTSRWFQFVMAWTGCAALQKGPLWWAAHHRDHHKYSDQEGDPHSPIKDSVLWSHIGWVLSSQHDRTKIEGIQDFAKYPELRLMDRLHWIPGMLLIPLCYWIDGISGVVWGFFVSTVLLYHTTFMVNSVCHLFGNRRYETTDESRNNWLVAILTLGEGWHNNHHHYMSSANQGFHWWEIDMSYYTLIALSKVGIVWDLRTPPEHKLVPTVGMKQSEMPAEMQQEHISA
jgi:stearoyl-CoA desaturase (Delta-9 desaturase)